MTEWVWPWGALLALALIALGAVAYWHLVIAEGAYLGPWLVAYLYDRFAHRYDRIKGFDWEDEQYFIARPLRLGFELIGVRHPFILDVGTGTGRVPRALWANGAFAGHIVALDRSLGMLQEAVRLVDASAPVSWLWQDASSLPFPDDTFDAVCCLEALEFMPDPRQALREMARVLRPGGFLLISNRVGWEARLLPRRAFRREEVPRLLADVGMASWDVRPWQVDYDWILARKAGRIADAGRGLCALEDYLRCPGCGEQRWLIGTDSWQCAGCHARFEYRDGILRLLKANNP